MKQWPHAPVHLIAEQGSYIVTCGTYQKRHHLQTADRLSLVQSRLFEVAEEFGWLLQAWAVLSNHYHFVAISPESPESLSTMLSKLHTTTAISLNREDEAPGRKVWYQYYETRITYQRSYFARLKYVHENPVHHGMVRNSEDYAWCSASWFASRANPSFHKTVQSFKVDQISVQDGFEPISPAARSESGVKPPHSIAQPQFNPEQLFKLIRWRMPFGKYKNCPLIDLPESYIVWFKNSGFPKGELGKLLEILYEIKLNGLEYLFEPLRSHEPEAGRARRYRNEEKGSN